METIPHAIIELLEGLVEPPPAIPQDCTRLGFWGAVSIDLDKQPVFLSLHLDSSPDPVPKAILGHGIVDIERAVLEARLQRVASKSNHKWPGYEEQSIVETFADSSLPP